MKSIIKKVVSREQAEGQGARVRRSIGSVGLRNLDPFLMLDEFNVGDTAGFPDHPHRGFETVTYMMEGVFQHEDFAGHKGTIGPNDVQWMTAGKGIVHAEMPLSKGFSKGLQLWVNLPSKFKLVEPDYQELLAKDIPIASDASGSIKVTVIAGSSYGVEAKVHTKTPIYYLDVTMQPNAVFEQDIPADYTAFFYTLSGSVYFEAMDPNEGDKPAELHSTYVLSPTGTAVRVATRQEAARFVLLAGEPINEPIVQHGPFVMNTQQEIRDAILDYQMGRNGFEKAPEWQSEIAKEFLSKLHL